MSVLIFLIIVAVIALFIFINVKIGDLKYRAKQHILKNSGISSSDISAGITGSFEQKYIQRFLIDYPNFTEKSLKELLKQYTIQIFSRTSVEQFSQNVCEKMQTDAKLDKMKMMDFRRINITSYSNSKLNVVAVYTDGKDEYNVYLICSVLENKIYLDKYRIAKGNVVGF